jgi:putative ABC transport system permease protein
MNAVLSGQMDSALKLYLSSTDIGIGLGVSIAVGILAGVVPAASAAKLDPVEAIRSK